jgi:hypothetical protein
LLKSQAFAWLFCFCSIDAALAESRFSKFNLDSILFHRGYAYYVVLKTLV